MTETTTTDTTEMTVTKLAEERNIVLHLDHAPHMTNDFGDITIDPYVVWITYRLETGHTEHTWHANVSGCRVRPGLPTDPTDTTSISLRTSLDHEFDDEAPAWLADLITSHTPTW